MKVYACMIRALNFEIVLAVHDNSPEFAWRAAERLSGMTKKQLEAVGYEIVESDLTPSDTPTDKTTGE